MYRTLDGFYLMKKVHFRLDLHDKIGYAKFVLSGILTSMVIEVLKSQYY